MDYIVDGRVNSLHCKYGAVHLDARLFYEWAFHQIQSYLSFW